MIERTPFSAVENEQFAGYLKERLAPILDEVGTRAEIEITWGQGNKTAFWVGKPSRHTPDRIIKVWFGDDAPAGGKDNG